jgi:methionyl-tRNA formyltransferase
MIVFFGTPEFAAAHLEGLLAAGLPVETVVTREDKPRGRGRAPAPSAVKALAARRGLEVLAPRRARDTAFVEAMRARRADLFAVVAYGSILPRELLALPRLGSVNLHASILPRWRGAAPVQRAIAAGDAVTGVTTMFMDEGVDTGDIILAEETPIGATENAGELLARLAPMGSDLLVRTVRLVLEGRAPRRPQDGALATLAPPLRKEEGWIAWREPAERIARLVRAVTPWPGARTRFRGETATLLAATPLPGAGEPGRVAAITREGIAIGTGEGLLRIDTIQMPSRRAVTGAEFARGARLAPGDTFAEEAERA